MNSSQSKEKNIKLLTEEDFEQFFKQRFEQYYYYGLHFVDDQEVVRDIVCDCYEYVFHNFQQRNDVKDWGVYVARMVRSRCMDHLRHCSVHESYANYYLLETSEMDDSLEDMQLYEERISLLRQGLSLLSPRTRLILTECYLNHKQYKEVAEALEISDNAVKKHIVKALKTLREFVGNNNDSSSMQNNSSISKPNKTIDEKDLLFLLIIALESTLMQLA